MLFSSKVFLFAFLPIVLFLYYAVGRIVKEKYRTVYRNVLLFISSLVFYAADNLYFLSVMLLSITANWLFGMAIDLAAVGRQTQIQSRSAGRRRRGCRRGRG